MGLLDRLKRGPEVMPANVEPGWATSSEWRERWEMPLNLVREGHYQAALVRMCGRSRAQGYLVPVEAVLVREPRNPHDRNAIRVEVKGALVGYVRREVAAQVGPALDRMRLPSMTVCAVIRGGAPEWENLGVHLWMARRLSPGPEIEFSGDLAIVEIGWPPHDGEGDDSYEPAPAKLKCPGCGKKGRARVLRLDAGVSYRCWLCQTEWPETSP